MTSISQDFSKVWMNFGWPSMYVLGTIRVPSAPPSQSENVVKFPEMIRFCQSLEGRHIVSLFDRDEIFVCL